MRAVLGVRRRGVPGGMGTGWVGGGVIPGTPSQLLGERSCNQRSGPRKPCKGWSGWVAGARASGYPPFGPGRVPAGPSLVTSSECRLWANKARFNLISQKLSQNGRVSLKYVEKACHSPYVQNRVQKSPLEILRFTFSVAFSHKELMGLF